MNAMICLLAILSSLCQFVADSDPTGLPDSELRALQHYEGVWDCNFTLGPQSQENEVTKFTGTVEGKWVVGGKFMEQTGTYRLNETSQPLVIKTLMYFDEKQQRYQYDYYISSGEIQRSFGKWDEQAKTMTSTMNDDKNGNVTTIVADFSKENTENWTIETNNREGNTVTRIVGTNKRRTK